MSAKFKITGVGIDTGNIIFKPSPENEDSYGYIHTNISKNNDFLISDYVKNQPGAALAVTVDFTDSLEQILSAHLKELGRSTADLLLIDVPSFDWSRILELIEPLKQSGLVGDVGIKNPESPDILEKMKASMATYSKNFFVAIDLCPFKYNIDIMEWVKENNAILLGFNPFGGYLSGPTVIESFSIPYLLAFAATHCSIVFLSGRDIFGSGQACNYLETLIGRDNPDLLKYTLKKSVNKLVKPVKRVIGTSLSIEPGSFVLSYDYPQFLYFLPDIEISLGKTVDILPSVPKDLYTSVERSIADLLEILYYPKDGSDNVIYALIRYKVLDHLRFIYPESTGWIIDLTNLGDRVLGIRVSRVTENSWFKKIKAAEPYNVDEHSFILALPDKDHKIFFESVNRGEMMTKNSPEKP